MGVFCVSSWANDDYEIMELNYESKHLLNSILELITELTPMF